MIPALVFTGIAILAVGYLVYGNWLTRRFGVEGDRETPANTHKDGVDFLPARRLVLLGHHFSSIAGAGPIVGPVIAAAAFGWLPAFLWVVLGAIFVGGVQDFGSLMASIRHRACSVAEIARTEISPLARTLFLVFVWFALIYVIVVFVDLTATTFTADPGVASSSVIYVVLAVALGLLIYRAKVPLAAASLVFVPLMFFGIYAGQQAGLALPGDQPAATWTLILLGYCFLASVLPVWILLQPRDYLSSFLLYGCLVGGIGGLALGGGALADSAELLPAFRGWYNEDWNLGWLFPALFVTIACGAASGFHSIVASGTTAKQLASERDAKPVAYGGMILEGVLALLSIAAVVIVGGAAAKGQAPTATFAQGLGTFMGALGIPAAVGTSFGLLAVSTFLLTTLDSCTRLARYVFEELFRFERGSEGTSQTLRSMGVTALTLVLPLILVYVPFTDGDGNPIPAWKAVWPVFGATNQLLGALALLVITAWLRNLGKPRLFAAIPMVFMFAISMLGLLQLGMDGSRILLVRIIANALLVLAGVLAFEGLTQALGRKAPRPT